jgi:tRNA (guanine-N7-)-methyltransferase
VKTAKDLIIPFTWTERRPILLERFFYMPAAYEYKREFIPFFEEEKPIFLEFCSGNGDWIAERAKQYPEFNWLAVEKKFIRARSIWLKIDRMELSNLTVACAEGATFARFYAPKVKEIFINFPDPWPKLRHAKHRIIRSPFLMSLLDIVEIGGRITCVTDDAQYAAEMEREFGKCPPWKFLFHVHEWPDYGRSFFNDLWIRKGRNIHYLCYEKI